MGRKQSVLAVIAVFSLLMGGCPGGGGGSGSSSSSDTTPPTVSSTQPADSATDVSTDTTVSATFSEAMTDTTLTTTTFTINGGGTAVTGTVAYSGATATFTPSANLAPNTAYTATITTGAKDLAGDPLAADYAWSFTTGPDTTPPTVFSTNPANNAVDVVLNTSISATFSEPMDPSTLTTATFTVTGGGSAVAGTVNYSGATATFTPSANLAAATVYTATITTGAKDLAGNPLANDYTWQFTSGGALDLTPPTVISTTPANNATNLPLSTAISATFSEAMDPATLTTATFTVTGGSPIAGTVGYSGTTATFTPAAGLTLGSSYTATITTGAKDLAGNSLASNYSWQFSMLAKPDLCVIPGGGGPNNCYAKINDALTAANTGNIIGVATGTYTEYVVIDKTVTLEGGWDLAFTALDPVANITTIQPPDSTFSVVHIKGVSDTSAVAPTLDGFTITGGGGGNHGGGLRITSSDAIVRNNIITNNTGYLYGGGVWVQSGAPTFENNRIENNTLDTSGGEGGGIELEGTKATLIGNTIDSNTVPTSTGYGGGIAIEGSGPVTLTNNTITNNAAATLAGAATDYAYGGGVSARSAAVVMNGNLIQSNTANSAASINTVIHSGGHGFGGGVYISGSTAFSLTGNTIDQNTAGDAYYDYIFGGGILIDSSQGQLSGNVISNNWTNRAKVFGNGGGIYATASTLTIHGGQIVNNSTAINYEGYGGGLYAKDSTVTIDATVVQNNKAANTPTYGKGGGLAFVNSPFTLTNAVVADNYSFGNDAGGDTVGGVYADATSTGVLINNTFANNRGQGVNTASPLTLANNIIAGHTTGTGVKLTAAVAVNSKNNDFYNNTTNATGFSLDLSDIVINPQLSSDYHLTAGSPMIDAGTHGPVLKAGSATETVDIPATDLDGESRAMIGPSGLYKVDIGADEYTGTAQRIVDLDAGGADLTVIGPGGDPDSSINAPTNDWIGYSVLGDDVNGDGKADLVTAAEDFAVDPDNAPFTPGRLFGLFNNSTRKTGTIDLLDSPADLIINNQMTLQHIGSALAGGDLNGDGKRDLIAGSYQDDGAGGGAVWPTVFVFWGGSSLTGSRLLDGTHPADFELRAPGQDFFAFSSKNALTTADLNADGKTDLTVGDGLANDGATTGTGAVFVIFGGSGLTGLHDLGTTAADYTVYGPAAAAGLQSAAVGKVDAGSQVDLVARTATTAYVIFGPISAGARHLGTTPADITITGLTAGGVAVMDLTGDGQDDLILGSADKVYVLPGPLAAGSYAATSVSGLITLTGTADAVAKDEVFAIGNVVGDSKLDLIIGSPTLKRAFVIAGGTSLSGTIAVADAAAMLVKSATLDHLGYDVAAGDLDNDGRPDLIVSTKQQSVTGHDISDPKYDDAGIVYVIYGK